MVKFGRWSKTQVLSVGFALTVALLNSACQTTGSGDGSVERAWLHGLHQIPAAARRDGLFNPFLLRKDIRSNPQDWQRQVGKTRLKPGAKLPAVIYLHGCVGLNANDDVWSDYFSDLGYAFFAPDSLARRPELCDLPYPVRGLYRHEEVDYALRQLRKADWIDQKQIILMGASEGGQAASDYNGREFAAIVIIANDCRHSNGFPNAPPDVPVLNMVGANDGQSRPGCNVGRTIGGSRSLEIKDAPHRLAGWPEARDALEQFLNECCTKPQ